MIAAFEAIPAFFNEFATTATFGPYRAEVILSMPGVDILGGRVESNQSEMEYATADLPGLTNGSSVTIHSTVYRVLQVYSVDDGMTTRARLQT